MKKKILTLSALGTIVVPLITSVSCTFNIQNDNNEHLERKMLNFSYWVDKDKQSEYKIYNSKIETFFDKDKIIPYINISSGINMLNGLLDSDSYTSSRVLFDNKIKYKSPYGSIVVDWKENTIKVNDISYFRYTQRGSTNYMKLLKTIGYDEFKLENKEVVFDLDKYGFDIKNYRGRVLIPFHVFNLLFGSQNYYNVYFDGNEYRGVETVVNSHWKNNWTNKLPTKSERLYSYNFLRFVFDYFYGLKEQKDIEDIDAYWNQNIISKITNTDKNIFMDGYSDFIYGELNELHTSLISNSFYHNANTFINPQLRLKSTKFKSYKNRLNELKNIWSEETNHYLTKLNKWLRIKHDMLVIKMDSFETNEDVVNISDNIDPSSFDSYTWLKTGISAVIESHPNIKKIVLDLSQNGGGSVAAMYRTLGLITDKPIVDYDYNNLTKIMNRITLLVNSSEKDIPFTKYKWFVLTGENTFSAANSFTAIFKQMKLGKVIGQKTGGGMCSLLYVTLPDGVSLGMSSPNCSNIYDEANGIYIPIENGIKPDIKIKYEDFYDLDYIYSITDIEN
ncbi:S41 family peptidase [Mycoplasma sp. Mirounga ES2805-ORL]|uniref:S41 family peptidase n=1 Tax=Mycoplasma sp. Mirounga ES2805-ORL TaxID=754514 RepID=UPI00197B8DC3|nr:S41 family peptidase [Mycoplasma sp. Mirounga ES2805-ORL]QSF13528.1 hypothetical protein JXZ90_02525 [Mycoplasma sp. Mirounga ES2805-ORL]